MSTKNIKASIDLGKNAIKAAYSAAKKVQQKTPAKTETETETPQETTNRVLPVNSYSNLYNAYADTMNTMNNAFAAQNAAQADDAARQLQIVGNQGKNALYGTQGLNGQGVSETSLLQNEMATGGTQGSVRSAYDAATRDVALANEQNLLDAQRDMGNQQVNYENQLESLMRSAGNDATDFEQQKRFDKELKDIEDKANETIYERQAFEDFGTDYTTIKAFNRAISKLKRDGDTSNDWKIEYLRTQRDKLQKEVDKQKLADAKNNFSKSLSKYTSTAQIDKAITKILSDGDTSNDWKLSYLNKYRTILNRKEVEARKAAKKSKSKSKKGGDGDDGDSKGKNAIDQAAKDFLEAHPGVAVNSATVDYYLATTDYNKSQKEAFKAYLQQRGAETIVRR